MTNDEAKIVAKDLADNYLNQAQAALLKYKESGTLPSIPDISNNGFDVWRVVFSEHPNVWTYITLEENRRDACWSLENLQKGLEEADDSLTFRKSMFSITAGLAVSRVNLYSKESLYSSRFENKERQQEWTTRFARVQPQVAKIWAEMFLSYAEDFKALLHDETWHYAKAYPDTVKLLFCQL